MNARTITTRQEAIRLGLGRYFTGKPCARGHYSERNRWHKCVECNRLKGNIFSRANPDIIKKRSRAHYVANKDARLERARAWRIANIDRDKERRAKYWAEREGLANLYARRRRARKAASHETHTLKDVADIAKAQKHRCAYCKTDLRKSPPQVDHIEPLARGGSNGRRNLQIVCRPCNSSKWAKDPIEFARSTGRLI